MGIAMPISKITSTMQSLAEGDLEVGIPATGRGDEIGKMATAVQIFKDNALRSRKLEAEQVQQKQQSEQAEKKAQEDAISSEREMVVSIIGKAMTAIAAKNLNYRITDEIPPAYLSFEGQFQPRH